MSRESRERARQRFKRKQYNRDHPVEVMVRPVKRHPGVAAAALAVAAALFIFNKVSLPEFELPASPDNNIEQDWSAQDEPKGEGPDNKDNKTGKKQPEPEGSQMSGTEAQDRARTALGKAGLDILAANNFVKVGSPDGVLGIINKTREDIASEYRFPAMTGATAACNVFVLAQDLGKVSIETVESIGRSTNGDMGDMFAACTAAAQESWTGDTLYPDKLQVPAS